MFSMNWEDFESQLLPDQSFSTRDPLGKDSSEYQWRENCYQVIKELRLAQMISLQAWNVAVETISNVFQKRTQAQASQMSIYEIFGGRKESHVTQSLAELFDAMNYWMTGWKLGRVHIMHMRQLYMRWAEELQAILDRRATYNWYQTVNTLGIPKETSPPNWHRMGMDENPWGF